MSSFIENIKKNSKYSIGDTLLCINDFDDIFIKNVSYKITKKEVIDYALDMLDNDYGKEIIYFKSGSIFAIDIPNYFIFQSKHRDSQISAILK